MPEVTFATGACGIEDAEAVYMLGRSIRDFAGGLSGIGLRVYVPEIYSDSWQAVANELNAAGITLRVYRAAREDLSFFYSFKPRAGLAAEQDIRTGTVIWLDRHSLVTGCCADLLLNDREQFAYRPVNIRNIGSLYDEPVSGFWKDAYEIAGISQDRLFPVYSSVDRQEINPYFYACIFAFRAELGIMAAWNRIFDELRLHPRMTAYLSDDEISTYLHQAALCLAVLSTVPRGRMRELPYYYGYPVHLHSDIPPAYRIDRLDRLNTAFLHRELHDFREATGDIAVSEELCGWLEESICESMRKIYKQG